MKRLFLALLVIPQIAFADRAFYSAFSLVPGASALGNIKYSATPFTITANTKDTADNMVAQLSGGGAIGETRGSYIAVHGNEHSNAGAVNLWAGNTVSSNINHVLNNASAKVQFFNASTAVMWDINNSGELTQNATDGGDIIISKNGSGLRKSGTGDVLHLSGGSTLNSSNAGGGISLFGGASGGSQGIARLFGGNQTTGHVEIQTNNASAEIRLQTNASTKWTIADAGTFIGAGTGTIGWTVLTGTNMTCTSSCVTPCVMGQDLDTANGPWVGCGSATSERCLCAGAS